MTVRDLLETSIHFDYIWVKHIREDIYFKYKDSTQVKELNNEVICWYTQIRKRNNETLSEIVIAIK